MAQFGVTLIAAFIFLALCLTGLAIGWILKGKVIKRGTCGYDPTLKKKGDCSEEAQKDCPLCGGGKAEKID